jgi:tetrahydromethanopterin S-methyltransferase subunit E
MVRFKNFIAYGVDMCLALVAVAEASLMLFEDFSAHPFDLVVLCFAFGMTVFCLFRSLRSKFMGQRRAY